MVNQVVTNQIVFTALKGALVDAAWVSGTLNGALDADYLQVKVAIAQLQSQGTAVVVFTDCDRAELEPFREQLGITSPFITESGSAIFTPVSHHPFEPALGEKDGDYYVEVLGCPYVQARAGLRVIANSISHPLKGFGDFTVDQLKRMTKVAEDVAHRAKSREFSEPFMTPKAVEIETLRTAAEEMGFGVVLRSDAEGRFSELIGAEAGLGKAAAQVVAAYQRQLPEGRRLKVMGVSDRAEDLSVLAEASGSADWTSVLLPSERVSPAEWLSAVKPLLA